MAEMTGGQALAKSLYREGVRVIFGLPGAQLYYATDALFDEPGIRWISTRNEQATTFMADGYARASGGIGTAMVVPGPGVLNATSGLSTAYSASSPVLLVAGQIPRDLIGVNRGMLHEIDDQLEAVKSVTKWAARVVNAGRRSLGGARGVPAAQHRAAAARGGRDSARHVGGGAGHRVAGARHALAYGPACGPDCGRRRGCWPRAMARWLSGQAAAQTRKGRRGR